MKALLKKLESGRYKKMSSNCFEIIGDSSFDYDQYLQMQGKMPKVTHIRK